MKISFITTCHGRERHLRNLLAGLARSTRVPDEILVVVTQPLALAGGFPQLPVREIVLPLLPDEAFPIGKARNVGARAARFPALVFLDVDCVPAPDFVEKMTQPGVFSDGLFMGNPRYLRKALPENWQTEDLVRNSELHPHRPVLGVPLRQEKNYGMFWSLCFAIHHRTFVRLGGFDERFQGYGAEDTDLAFRAEASEVPFHLVDAWVFHQQHPVYQPPLNHFSNIIQNARLFCTKWHHWPMRGWLTEFRALGLIDWSGQEDDSLEIIELPSDALLAAHYQPDAAHI